MATCSFLTATDAINLSRTNSLIWGEICALQTAIIAAIEGDPCATPPVIGARSVIVAGETPFTKTSAITAVDVTEGGSGYDTTSATAAVNANGTGGYGATIIPNVNTSGVIYSFAVTLGGGAGLTSAAVATAGVGYSLNDTLTLAGGIFSTVATANVDTLSTISSQDETNFDGAGSNGTWVGGDGAGGTAYVAADTITLSDGTVITVDIVDGNDDVTQFTVTSTSTSGIALENTTLTQTSTSGTGAGFTLTLGDANQGAFSASVVTNGGYSSVPANPVATTVSPAGGTGLTLTATFSDGYVPVDATASLSTPSVLDPANQTNTDFEPTRLIRGSNFAVNDTITLTNNAIVNVDTITDTNFVTIISQTQANYPGTGAPNGDFTAGADYSALDELTLNDGTVVRVDTVDGLGGVTGFTVIETSTTALTTTGQTRVQVSVDPDTSAGTGFTLETGTANEEAVGPVATFTITSIGNAFFLPTALSQSGTDPAVGDAAGTNAIGTGFSITPISPNNVTTSGGGAGALLTPVVTSGAITNVVINAPGSGYLINTPVVVTHPSGTGFTGYVSSVGDGGTNPLGAILAITVSAGGSGYETVNPTVTITHPTGFGFEGTVQVGSGGEVTGISVQDGGAQYGDLSPTAAVESASDGTGATFTVNTTAGVVTSIDVVTGGYDYSIGDVVDITPAITGVDGSGDFIYDVVGSPVAAGAVSEVDGSTVSNIYYDPSDYYMVLSGQATDVVIADQLQYVLDYFTALGYNIRAQVNPATNNTIQWQIIW